MASLSNLLGNRAAPFVEETGLEQGEIFAFYPPCYNPGNAATGCVCWNSPGTGYAVVEIWGAGGSGGKMCCCGAGIPGNPGAYSKKCICVDGNTWIRGILGMSCSNDNLCFKGCSSSTCIHICSPNALLTGGRGNANCICMCAQGGNGGMTYCNGSSQPACCFSANGYCYSQIAGAGGACFVVCNVGAFNPKCAYGGDINCHSGSPGGNNFSCTTFWTCYPCKCAQNDHVAVPPGIFGTDGGLATIQRECYSNMYDGSGDGGSQLIGALNIMGRSPTVGGHVNTNCWSSGRQCGCYEWAHCLPFLPYGIPGTSGIAPDSVRDYGYRGGHGALRIKFIGA